MQLLYAFGEVTELAAGGFFMGLVSLSASDMYAGARIFSPLDRGATFFMENISLKSA